MNRPRMIIETLCIKLIKRIANSKISVTSCWIVHKFEKYTYALLTIYCKVCRVIEFSMRRFQFIRTVCVVRWFIIDGGCRDSHMMGNELVRVDIHTKFARSSGVLMTSRAPALPDAARHRALNNATRSQVPTSRRRCVCGAAANKLSTRVDDPLPWQYARLDFLLNYTTE